VGVVEEPSDTIGAVPLTPVTVPPELVGTTQVPSPLKKVVLPPPDGT
jgi:hypothetical protein